MYIVWQLAYIKTSEYNIEFKAWIESNQTKITEVLKKRKKKKKKEFEVTCLMSLATTRGKKVMGSDPILVVFCTVCVRVWRFTNI